MRVSQGQALIGLLAGSYVCLAGWGFAFSPAGVPLLVIGSVIILAAILVHPTVRFLVAGVMLVFLAWGDPSGSFAPLLADDQRWRGASRRCEGAQGPGVAAALRPLMTAKTTVTVAEEESVEGGSTGGAVTGRGVANGIGGGGATVGTGKRADAP